MVEEERHKCDECDRDFGSLESLNMHKSAKHSSNIPKEDKKASFNFKKARNWGIFLIIAFGIFWFIFSSFSSIKTLPPTDMQGHVEQIPSSHVLREPMNILVQKHMLEHVDGEDGTRGGVIINYNCKDYSCENGLIENLETFASYYNYVYVAPFKNMDAKIALTKLNQIEILEEYDVNKIHIFASGRVPIDEELGISTPADSEQGQIGDELVQTNTKEFDVVAKQWQFIPSTIEVNEGDTVILNIKSVDVSHGIAIPGFNVDEFLSPGNEVRIEFTADNKGTFFFACSVSCGVGHSGMIGKIVVN